jgi:hypothetical protein
MRSEEKSVTAVTKNGETQVTVRNCNGLEVGAILVGVVSTAIKAFESVLPRTVVKRLVLNSVMSGFSQSGMKITPKDLQELADAIEENAEDNIEGTA